jgi:NAD(P)-dependent dehydrogenase (short-subunit alcohol dehydrogenase family)
MSGQLRFDGKVVIVTGAGQGLGRSHALAFASRGAKVVVNDLGGAATGGGKSSAAADKVVAEIKAAGGEAVANYDSVEDGAAIVKTAIDAFGRIDVVVNNAGILRDSSFPKMTDADWELIFRVHMLGAFRVTHAAWPYMRDQGYGRSSLPRRRLASTATSARPTTAPPSSDWSASPAPSPSRAARRTFASTPSHRSPARAHRNRDAQGSRRCAQARVRQPGGALLCHEDCKETGGLFEVGGGFVAKLRWERTRGKIWKLGRAIQPENIQKAWPEITDFADATHPENITASMQPVMNNLSRRAGVATT